MRVRRWNSSSVVIPLVRAKDGAVIGSTIVDAADYEKASVYVWRLSGEGYVSRTAGMFLHRYLMNAPKGIQVDHVDRNPLNNQRSNLRFATNSQQASNRRKPPGTSQYRGVCKDTKRGGWLAHIIHHSKCIHVGRFQREYDAAVAWDRKALELRGEFAQLNFPEVPNESS